MGKSTTITLYLFAYNLLQTIGWAYILYKGSSYLHLKIEGTSSGLWNSVELPLKIFQTAAILEILHALSGIVKSNVSITVFQIAGRLLNIWCIASISPPTQTSIGLPIELVAWCITEIIRYGYYTTTILQVNNSILQWLRYSMFIILYPMGAAGELICIYYAAGYVKDKTIWANIIPKALDFGFSYYYIIVGLSSILFPLTPILYFHMLSQRRKILGGGSKKAKSK